jgi:oligopeptide transport system substrate-binding protein
MTTNQHLNVLEASGLVRQVQLEPELEYLFRHALIQDAAYQSILRTDRRALHRMVGTTLERLYPEQLDELAPILGWHFEEAGEIGKAIEYLLRAGDRARSLYASQEAIEAYQRALTWLKAQSEHERAARTLMKLGLTYHTAFDFRQSRQAYEEAFVLWQRAGDEQLTSLPPAPHPFRIAWDDPHTLDPNMAGDTRSVELCCQLFSGLVELSAEMNVTPDLAQRWETFDGGRRWLFYLRTDSRWSDGTPVTAGDFEYAWKRLLDPATRSPNARLLYDIRGAQTFHQQGGTSVDQVGVRALNRHTLEVELEGPTSYFLHLLAQSVAFPVPRHVVASQGPDWFLPGRIVTNGPFRLLEWQREHSMLMGRNPTYHGRFTGNVEQAYFRFRPAGAPEDPFAWYEAGELEITGIPANQVNHVREQHADEYLSVPWLMVNYLLFDLRRPPFDDVRLRRALALATDRETLADVIQGGLAVPAMGGFVPPGMPGHSAGIGLPFDPAEARRLLAEAGYPDGRGFPPLVAYAHFGGPTIEFYQTQWREHLGIDIQWEIRDLQTLMGWMREDEKRPALSLHGWIADYPDPDNYLRASPLRAYSGWQHPEFDRLVEEARRTANQNERLQVYRQADRILVEELPIIPCLYGRNHRLLKSWVRKYPSSPVRGLFLKEIVIEPHEPEKPVAHGHS